MMIKSTLHKGKKTSQEMGMRMEQWEEALCVSPTLNSRTVADLGHTCCFQKELL